MKKSLIALAALAASGFAMAQSSVTLFGTVDAAVTYSKGATNATAMNNSGLSSSALGFRGVEDLGNGLKAGFWLEGGLSNDDGTGVGGKDNGDTNAGFEFKRRSTLSLMGGFGELRLGRDLTAAYTAVSRYDVFGTLGAGSSRLWNSAAGFQNVRRGNMLAYLSPDFGGFKVNVNYALGERVQDTTSTTLAIREARTGDTAGVALTYDNGPLSLGLGYQETGRAIIGGTEEKYWSLGGSYDFRVVKLLAAYTNTNQKNVAGEGTTDNDGTNYMIGLSAPVGAAGVVKASYNRYERDTNVVGSVNAKADQYSLGYVHNLSKRTAVYGTYAYLKNKNNGAIFSLNHSNSVGFDSGKQQAVQVGVRHSF